MKKIICIMIILLMMITGCQLQKEDNKGDDTTSKEQSETKDDSSPKEASDKPTTTNITDDSGKTKLNLTMINEGTGEEVATRFLNTFLEGDFTKLLTKFGYDKMLDGKLDEAILKTVSQQITAGAGVFEKIVSIYTAKQNGMNVVTIVSKFANATLDVKISFNQDQYINGFNFVPHIEKPLPETVAEESITVGSDEYPLTGALTYPKNSDSYPMIILVHGSGPADMNETVGPNTAFLDIAYGLGEQGVGVLRYNKRTLEHSQKIMENAATLTVYEETIDDVVHAYNYLREDQQWKGKIYILGHSLGGYLMPRIAKELPDADGYIMLAGSASPLEDLFEYQISYLANLDGVVTEEEQTRIDYFNSVVSKVRTLDKNSDYTLQDLGGIPMAYWLDLQNYDPVDMASTIKKPLLLLQGIRDYQVTIEEFNLYKEGLSNMSNVTFKLYEGLNHLFMKGEGTPGPTEYNIPSTVEQVVIDDIASFVK